jgi:GGDEF domain-containing protein
VLRLRALAARVRSLACKIVRLGGEEFIRGFASKAGGITAIALGALGLAYLLGVNPAAAVRAVLGV